MDMPEYKVRVWTVDTPVMGTGRAVLGLGA